MDDAALRRVDRCHCVQVLRWKFNAFRLQVKVRVVHAAQVRLVLEGISPALDQVEDLLLKCRRGIVLGSNDVDQIANKVLGRDLQVEPPAAVLDTRFQDLTTR